MPKYRANNGVVARKSRMVMSESALFDSYRQETLGLSYNEYQVCALKPKHFFHLLFLLNISQSVCYSIVHILKNIYTCKLYKKLYFFPACFLHA